MKKLMKIVKKTPKRSNNMSRIVAVAVVTAVVSFGVGFALSGNKPDQTDCKGTCVALYENKAHPDTLAVKTGSFVQFNSNDGKTHSLSLGKGGEAHSHTGTFSSGDFESNEAWRVQFKKEGTYAFHDHYNPKINVLIVVYTPGKDYKIQ